MQLPQKSLTPDEIGALTVVIYLKMKGEVKIIYGNNSSLNSGANTEVLKAACDKNEIHLAPDGTQ